MRFFRMESIEKQKLLLNEAFSLLEMAIALTIIIALAAVVTMGDNIMKQARLRSVITDIENMKGMINTFDLKYEYLPGDMPNAYSYWGSNCNASAGTCNGDGNDYIDYGPTGGEKWMVWRHMQLATIMPGNLTGLGVSNTSVVGVNIPKSKWPNAGYTYQTDGSFGISSTKRRHGFRIGGNDNSWRNSGNIFTHRQAYWLDEKADDGNALKGFYIGFGDCSTGYDLTLDGIACHTGVLFDKENSGGY